MPMEAPPRHLRRHTKGTWRLGDFRVWGIEVASGMSGNAGEEFRVRALWPYDLPEGHPKYRARTVKISKPARATFFSHAAVKHQSPVLEPVRVTPCLGPYAIVNSVLGGINRLPLIAPWGLFREPLA